MFMSDTVATVSYMSRSKETQARPESVLAYEQTLCLLCIASFQSKNNMKVDSLQNYEIIDSFCAFYNQFHNLKLF